MGDAVIKEWKFHPGGTQMMESWTSLHLQRKRRARIFREPPGGWAPPRSREEVGFTPISCGENHLWTNFQRGNPEVNRRSALPAPGSIEPAGFGPMRTCWWSRLQQLHARCCFVLNFVPLVLTVSNKFGEDRREHIQVPSCLMAEKVLLTLSSPCFSCEHWKLAHPAQCLLGNPGFTRTHRLFSDPWNGPNNSFFLKNTPSRAWYKDLFYDSGHSY